MFPVAVDYEPAPGPVEADQRGPYSANELSAYLWRVHYHYVPGEPPLELGDPTLVSELDGRERHLWLWQVGDQSERLWYLVVGSGRSPFVEDDQHCHRWVSAAEADDEDPVAFLARVAAELAT